MATVLELADELLDVLFDASPVVATVLGIRGRDDRLTDYSEAADEQLRTRVLDVAARAEAVDPESLDVDERVTRAVILQQAQVMVDHLAARSVEYTISDFFAAPVAALLNMLPMVSIAEQSHADGYLGRLGRLPEALSTIGQRHRAGVAAGRLPVRHLVEAAVSHLDRYLTNRDQDPLRRPRPPAQNLRQTGLDLIAKLADEYAAIGSRVFGTSDVAEIFTRLRTDPTLRWKTADELLDSACAAIARADEAAPRWFGTLPSQRCTIEAVPADEAPGAYYLEPAMDGTRPGIAGRPGGVAVRAGMSAGGAPALATTLAA